jgi:hypothetical protein
VDKLRDRRYMDCGILRVYGQCQQDEKVMNAPTKGDMGFFSIKTKVIEGDKKKISKCWKQRLFTITK